MVLRRSFLAGIILDSHHSSHLIDSDDTDSPDHICGTDRDGYHLNAFSNKQIVPKIMGILIKDKNKISLTT